MEENLGLHKRCVCCKDIKELVFFQKQVNGNGKKCRDSICNKCKNDKYNFGDLKLKLVNNNLKSVYKTCNYMVKKYNISAKEYTLLFKLQEGKCAVCKIHQIKLKKRLSVDHCHITGKVRGLLCPSCNTGLGFFKNDKHNLQNAINYLIDSYK